MEKTNTEFLSSLSINREWNLQMLAGNGLKQKKKQTSKLPGENSITGSQMKTLHEVTSAWEKVLIFWMLTEPVWRIVCTDARFC